MKLRPYQDRAVGLLLDHLDAPPVTLTARPHRPAYGSDGDYFSKPNAEDVFDAIAELMLV